MTQNLEPCGIMERQAATYPDCGASGSLRKSYSMQWSVYTKMLKSKHPAAFVRKFGTIPKITGTHHLRRSICQKMCVHSKFSHTNRKFISSWLHIPLYTHEYSIISNLSFAILLRHVLIQVIYIYSRYINSLYTPSMRTNLHGTPHYHFPRWTSHWNFARPWLPFKYLLPERAYSMQKGM